MMTSFQPGDLCQLKSGGPLMTVGKVEDNGSITCGWGANDGTADWATFTPSALRLLREVQPAMAAGPELPKAEAPRILLIDTESYEPTFSGAEPEYTLKFMVGGGPPPYPTVNVPVTKAVHEAALAMFEEARKRVQGVTGAGP